jgi:hypothetical protein
MSTNLAELAMGARGAGTLANLASSYNPNNSAISSLGTAAGSLGNGLGIVGGLEQGGVAGYGGAAVNAAQLGSKTGAFGAQTSNVNQGIGDAANALGIYQGIKQGGVGGYGSAALNAGQLGLHGAVQAGALSAADAAPYLSALNYAAIPLDVYNEVNNWKSGATGSDALAGASTGAAVGTAIVPGIGTAIGGLIGGAAGALSSLFGPGAKDPETSDVQNVINATSANQNNPGVAASVQDPYLQLAGLMDERSSTLPEYQQYGRMGEQAFTNAMTQKINAAVAQNPSLVNNPEGVYNAVVAPWVNSMGSGYSNVGSTYAATNQGLLEDMTQQYLSGQAANDWKAVGGDSPFANIYQGSPIAGAPPPETAQQVLNQVPISARGPSQVRPQMAKGGHMARKKDDGGRARRKSVLDSIRPNFKDAPRHYDGGGYVDYGGGGGGSLNYFNPTIPYLETSPTLNATPTMQDPTQSGNVWNQSELDQALNSPNDPANSNILGSAGTTGGSTSGGGLGSLAKEVAPYAALLPILGSLAGKLGGSGSSASGASLPSGQSSAPTGPFQAQSSPRTANPIDPNTDWYTYGQHPETQFFSNNSIAPLMGSFVSPQASQPTPQTPGAMPGGPSTPPGGGGVSVQPVTGPRPVMNAKGGALDTVEEAIPPETGESRYVRGPGDGQSDDIDAKLSDGEYVMDAHTVSMLGNGSNEAGAKRLDELRANLRKQAAKPMAKGKQFMKAKEPMAYLKGGSKVAMKRGGRVKGRGKPVVFGPVSGDSIDYFSNWKE